MKVVVVGVYPLDNIYAGTGSLTYVARLLYHISRMRNIELHVVTLGKENKQFKKDNLNIHVIKVSKWFYIPPLTPILLLSLKRKINEIAPDIVHGITIEFPYSTGAALVRNEYPVVLTMYGIIGKEIWYHDKVIPFIRGLLTHMPNERYVVSKIPNIITDAPSIKDIISKWAKSKIYVVPAGVEYDKVEEIQSRTLLNESPDIFIVVNLEKLKGVDILIKAISKVRTSIPNINVCIAGSGPQENELKSLVKKLNLEEHIKFLGFISEEEKYQYYKACKLVVVPSRWDCQPITLFEAAASGKPIIASDMSNPGIVEDGKTGLIFKSEDIKDLADKIVTLLKNGKLREKMGIAAKEKVKQYDWSKVAERYVEIYKEVISDFHERKAKDKRRRKTS